MRENNFSKMKAFVLCICTLACISFISGETGKEKVYSALSNDKKDDIENKILYCYVELNMSSEIMFSENDIINDVHLRPGMEERKEKNGCFVECILKTLGMMEGTEIKEQKIHAEIAKAMEGNSKEAKAHKIARDCVREVKNITHECEKGFAMMVCVGKSVSLWVEHE